MTESLTIRWISREDYAATRQLVDDAFRPEDVVTFLNVLRGDGCILREWVAHDGSVLVGHIVFSRVWIAYPTGVRRAAAMLTPLAVRPDHQRTGIGTRLMRHALAALEIQGESFFCVLGHPSYYPRVGFRPVIPAEISSPWPNDPAFMVRGEVPTGGTLQMPKVIADAH